MNVKIYHNPRCQKSRLTLQLLQQHGIEPEIVEYLKTPPTVAELTALLQLLAMSARDLMRTKEAEYQHWRDVTDEQTLIQAMVEQPILIERPIVVANGKAIVARPPEAVLTIL